MFITFARPGTTKNQTFYSTCSAPKTNKPLRVYRFLIRGQTKPLGLCSFRRRRPTKHYFYTVCSNPGTGHPARLHRFLRRKPTTMSSSKWSVPVPGGDTEAITCTASPDLRTKKPRGIYSLFLCRGQANQKF